MQELEKNLGGMDDENPDPRQMGKMMRKMCELTGEKMDGVMEEVVRKLEEGANPEELEEKMGGQMEEMESEDNGADASEDKGKKLRSPSDPRKFSSARKNLQKTKAHASRVSSTISGTSAIVRCTASGWQPARSFRSVHRIVVARLRVSWNGKTGSGFLGTRAVPSCCLTDHGLETTCNCGALPVVTGLFPCAFSHHSENQPG